MEAEALNGAGAGAADGREPVESRTKSMKDILKEVRYCFTVRRFY